MNIINKTIFVWHFNLKNYELALTFSSQDANLLKNALSCSMGPFIYSRQVPQSFKDQRVPDPDKGFDIARIRVLAFRSIGLSPKHFQNL